MTGGTLSGTIISYAVKNEAQNKKNPLMFAGYADASYTITEYMGEDGTVSRHVYTHGAAAVPSASESFELDGETFYRNFGLTEEFADANGATHTAGDITITETVGDYGTTNIVFAGIVANVMTEKQKAAFDSTYTDDDLLHLYIVLQVAAEPRVPVSYTTSGEKTFTLDNFDGSATAYDQLVLEVMSVSANPSDALTASYGVITSGFSMTVTMTDEKGAETIYTVTLGDIYIPKSAWTSGE